MAKILVVLSGGLDSTTLLYHHLAQKDEVMALGINYGQRHGKELSFATSSAFRKGVPFQIAELCNLADLIPGSSQTDASVAVPDGHYTEEVMKKTVVPNRNMILLAVSLAHAIAHKCDAVSYAAHSGDHAIYPDCRPEFAEAMDRAARLCDWSPAEVLRPFIHLTKAQIAAKAHELGVDFSQTWSCYKGGASHCGRCGTCIERREAIHLAGLKDNTAYQLHAPTIEELVSKGWKI